jgi:hypothetical protein
MVSNAPIKRFQFENFNSTEIEFQESMIAEHNRIRQANNQYLLKIDTFLSLLAFNWAEALSYRGTMEFCKDLNVERVCDHVNFGDIATELKLIYNVRTIAQNLYFLPYVPRNFAILCRTITRNWYSSNSIDYIKQDADASTVQAYTFDQLQTDCDFAGFGYSKSPNVDSFYVVAFYHPFVH